jgi:hypothetical protein
MMRQIFVEGLLGNHLFTCGECIVLSILFTPSPGNYSDIHFVSLEILPCCSEIILLDRSALLPWIASLSWLM